MKSTRISMAETQAHTNASEDGMKVGIGVGWLCGPTKDPKNDGKTV
jgi:hypothetical protein